MRPARTAQRGFNTLSRQPERSVNLSIRQASPALQQHRFDCSQLGLQLIAVRQQARQRLKWRRHIDTYIRWYNEKRIKISLGSLSPLEYRESLGLTT